MKRKRLQIMAVVISLILVTLLLAIACAKPAPTTAPATTTAPVPTTAPATTTAPAPVPIELKFSDPMAPGGAMTVNIFQGMFVKELQERTNGRLKVTIYSGGSLGALPQQYDLAVTGAADIACMDATTTPGVFPRADIMTLPLFWKSNEAASRTAWDMIQKYMADTEFKKVKVVSTHTTGTHQIWSNTKQVKTLEDLKGMKMAAQSPMQTQILKAFGAAPVFMIQPDIYSALERGLVDGELFGWDGAAAFRIPEVTKYRTGSLDVCTGPLDIVMNLDTYHSLPGDIQKIIDEIGPDWSRRVGAWFDERDVLSRAQIEEYDKEAGNPPTYDLPKDERARWKEFLQPVIDAWVADMEAKGLPGKAMIADITALLEKYSK